MKRIIRKTLIVLLMLVVCSQTTLTGFAAKKTDYGVGEKTPASNYIKSKNWPKAPDINAYAAVLLDADTGTVLYAKNPDTKMYPASITKIMTALLTIENTKSSDKVVFEGEALTPLPGNYVNISPTPGEVLTRDDALRALLMYSANDVANALAVHNSKTIAAFAEEMNKRAKQAGAKNTHFNNPSGLHEKNHYTTAYDMAVIMKDCIQYDIFKKFASERIYTLKKNKKRKEDFTFVAKDAMLFPTRSEYYKYCVCGKTGYTEEAINTLVTYAKKGDMNLICCVMKCNAGYSYKDTKALCEYGFDNFSRVDASELEKRYTLSDTGIFKSGSIGNNSIVKIDIPKKSYVILPKGVSFDKLDAEIKYFDDVKSGIFATLNYTYQGTDLGSVKLKISGNENKSSNVNFENISETSKDESAEAKQDNVKNIWHGEKGLYPRTAAIIGCVIVLASMLIIFIIKKKNKGGMNFKKKRKH